MERNLRRILNGDVPKMPTSTNDISRAFEDAATMDQYGFNLRKTERFYIDTVQNDNHSFTLFASYEIIRMIEKYIPGDRHYLMDGTFDVTPIGPFSQLLIIYIEHQNDVSGGHFCFAYSTFHILGSLLKN